ncbi:XkdF-like putative serine protease domain-containing protein [Rufibacter ruber]|uniref:XkdF-like putative serine protease domain-containing protein n=1 Tax=Rufibacter ruber TaxID=1783499 RepID=UPI000836ED44|nr:XkdF-like putative serine protease domain-containing protein [Rufibacter ruber]
MNKDLPVYRFDVDDLDDTKGIQLISVVDRPAIEVDFVKLAKEDYSVKLASDKAKQYATGPILIPEKLVYRRIKETGFEYYMTFGRDEIERIRNKFMRQGETKHSNLDHSAHDEIEGILIESWIVEDPAIDKSAALGFKGIVPGTLFATYHFPDPKVWAEVESRNGFSLEGKFVLADIKLETQKDQAEDILNDLVDLLDL